MPSEFVMAKGDLLVVSKHADASFAAEGIGVALFWFNTPVKGKCLSVEYNILNSPAVHVCIQANWKAKRRIARYRKPDEQREATWEETRF